MHYAYVEKLDKGVNVHFRKLDCTNFADTEILSLVLNQDKQVELDNIPFNIQLYGISERYAIVALLQLNCNNVDNNSKLLLLDAEENKYYTIPTKLGESDSFLRMNSILVREHDEKTYILIKTGLLAYYEKENIYKDKLQKQDEHCDCLETLVCLDSDNFIKCIKEGLDIPEHFIVDSCDYKCSFAYYTLKEGKVNYQKHDFPSETSEIVKYDLQLL